MFPPCVYVLCGSLVLSPIQKLTNATGFAMFLQADAAATVRGFLESEALPVLTRRPQSSDVTSDPDASLVLSDAKGRVAPTRLSEKSLQNRTHVDVAQCI